MTLGSEPKGWVGNEALGGLISDGDIWTITVNKFVVYNMLKKLDWVPRESENWYRLVLVFELSFGDSLNAGLGGSFKFGKRSECSIKRLSGILLGAFTLVGFGFTATIIFHFAD